MPDTLRTQLRRWIEPGLTALPTRLQPYYSARAEEEIAGFEDVGWLDQAADVVSAVGRLVAHGVPLIAAHRSCESMVFFLAGLTGTDPVAERLSDAYLPGIAGLDPAWLWFGPWDAGTHVSAHLALTNLLPLDHDSALACRWRNSAPHEIRRLRAQKPPWEAYFPRRAPESWSELVLQHACNTPGGGGSAWSRRRQGRCGMNVDRPVLTSNGQGVSQSSKTMWSSSSVRLSAPRERIQRESTPCDVQSVAGTTPASAPRLGQST